LHDSKKKFINHYMAALLRHYAIEVNKGILQRCKRGEYSSV